MSSRYYVSAGMLLIVMGIAYLRGIVDLPTWLGVWNLVMGGFAVLHGASRWLKGQ